MQRPKPLILAILDGFGVSEEKTGNPVAAASTPTLRMLEEYFPFTTLQASGAAVGLPWGEAGNSEVGHLTIGSGRVIYHHLPRIIYAIYDGSFFTNTTLKEAAHHVRTHTSRLHIVGLISSGSVHSYIDHLYALLEFSAREEIGEVYLHVITDGKDAPPREAEKFMRQLEDRMHTEWPHAHLASVIGRLWALDRDGNWDRTQKAYQLLVRGEGAHIRSVPDYLRDSYHQGLTDERIEPATVTKEDATPFMLIQNGDAMIFSDFREDSMRQLVHAFADEDFSHFARVKIKDLFIVTMTEYQKGLPVHPAFPQLDITWPLARLLGEAGLSHLHIAETQKYAHVTYFLNGGQEDPFRGEERILIHSPSTASLEETPEMRASEIAQAIIEHRAAYDVIIANFANADIVGHAGNFSAAVRTVEALDQALKQLIDTVLADEHALLIITGDHGNIELKRNTISGERLTEHSTNPVPFFLVGKKFRRASRRNDKEITALRTEVGGILTDVTPTILDLLHLPKPQEMTGKSLLENLERE